MKILVTGGCGYKGSVLIPKLLNKGYEVTSFDTQWFGNYHQETKNLKNIKGDIRDISQLNLKDFGTVIHLANIANDPAVELNPTMSWEVNVLASQQIADKAVREGVEHFIFASSGSVYGIKEEEKVTEDLELVPLSVYNKTKMVAERVFLSYSNQMKVHCLRPATVCGMSPRMRLDVAVNMLTFQALKKGEITVLGGQQTRPNIHIDDIADMYIHLIENKDSISSGNYNAGFENISILDIAKTIQKEIDCKIVIKESNDPRSYRQDSQKILDTGFKPKKSVSLAIKELIEAFKNGILIDKPEFHTVKWMKKNQFN